MLKYIYIYIISKNRTFSVLIKLLACVLFQEHPLDLGYKFWRSSMWKNISSTLSVPYLPVVLCYTFDGLLGYKKENFLLTLYLKKKKKTTLVI